MKVYIFSWFLLGPDIDMNVYKLTFLSVLFLFLVIVWMNVKNWFAGQKKSLNDLQWGVNFGGCAGHNHI